MALLPEGLHETPASLDESPSARPTTLTYSPNQSATSRVAHPPRSNSAAGRSASSAPRTRRQRAPIASSRRIADSWECFVYKLKDCRIKTTTSRSEGERRPFCPMLSIQSSHRSQKQEFYQVFTMGHGESPRYARWPQGIAPPGLPRTRTCRFPASGSSGHGFAVR